MQLFRVKWERILTLMMLATTVYTWIAYFKYESDVKMLAVAIMTTGLLMMMLMIYNEIKAFRHEAIKLWK